MNECLPSCGADYIAVWVWDVDALPAIDPQIGPVPSPLSATARVKWQDRIPNTDLLNTCGIMGLEAFLLKAQLRWLGHIMRMPDSRIPKQVFLA